MMKKLMTTTIAAVMLIGGSFSTAAFAAEKNDAYTGNYNFQFENLPFFNIGSLFTQPPQQVDAPAMEPAPAKSVPAAEPAPAAKPAPAAEPAQASASTDADKLIEFAKSLQGKVQYGYGKRDTSNPNNMLFDCSSFTQYVYKQALGIQMGWGANKQHDAFPHVAKSDLRKGDLVFFSVSNPKQIGHVGIYMGDGKFIHNVNPKSDVEISDLTIGYWNNHYIDGARPLQ